MLEITNNQNQTPNHTNMADNQPKQDDHNIISTKLSRKKTSRSFKLRSHTLDSLRLRRVFDLFDKNGDGVISIDEIKQALVLLGLDDDPVSDPDADPFDDLNTIVSAFIRPGNKGLIFEDFKALHNSLNANFFSKDLHPNEVYDEEDQVESDLSEAFKVFDSDGDGFISAIELEQVLSKLGFPEAQQELQHIQLMISSFDHNHDGLGTSSLSFMDMFEWLWKANGPSSVEQFMIFGWQLWKAQNDAIFNNIEDPPMLCVRKALDWLKEYQKALTFGLECKSPAGPGRREGVWAKSPTRFIKINVDGAFKESEDKHGIGVIARDSSGNCVLAGARTLWMDGPTEMVEAQAFMWALDLAKIHGWHKLIIEGDCQFSSRLLKALENFPSIFKP